MHEHLLIGLPGWQGDTSAAPQSMAEISAICVDYIAELKGGGIDSMVDPCPNDLGRDPMLMAEVSAKTGFNIICATGLYNHHLGGAYWRAKVQFDADAESRLADLFVKEITEGIGDTGVRAGIIKVATGEGVMTDYERVVFRAAARASCITGTPITTHTEAVLGLEQIELLTSMGVPAQRIIIGHSCGSTDHAYHCGIVDKGAYVGFDRFGFEIILEDRVRAEHLAKLVARGNIDRLVVSHDCVCMLRGNGIPPEVRAGMVPADRALHFTRKIAPMLNDLGVTSQQIDTIMIGNPAQYFGGANGCGSKISECPE